MNTRLAQRIMIAGVVWLAACTDRTEPELNGTWVLEAMATGEGTNMCRMRGVFNLTTSEFSRLYWEFDSAGVTRRDTIPARIVKVRDLTLQAPDSTLFSMGPATLYEAGPGFIWGGWVCRQGITGNWFLRKVVRSTGNGIVD